MLCVTLSRWVAPQLAGPLEFFTVVYMSTIWFTTKDNKSLIQKKKENVNDSSRCRRKHNYLTYKPYGKDFPWDQVILLTLWNKLGIPHQLHKQLHGSPLLVISTTMDANTLSMSLSDESKEMLITELRWWCKLGRKEKLHRWYQMLWLQTIIELSTVKVKEKFVQRFNEPLKNASYPTSIVFKGRSLQSPPYSIWTPLDSSPLGLNSEWNPTISEQNQFVWVLN